LWTVEDGRLQQRTVTLGHRLLDGRFEITTGVPDNALVVSQLRNGLRVGRSAKVASEKIP
jgi:HlyD family secretion protein